MSEIRTPATWEAVKQIVKLLEPGHKITVEPSPNDGIYALTFITSDAA